MYTCYIYICYKPHTFQKKLKQMIKLEFFDNTNFVATGIENFEVIGTICNSFLCEIIHASM